MQVLVIPVVYSRTRNAFAAHAGDAMADVATAARMSFRIGLSVSLLMGRANAHNMAKLRRREAREQRPQITGSHILKAVAAYH